MPGTCRRAAQRAGAIFLLFGLLVPGLRSAPAVREKKAESGHLIRSVPYQPWQRRNWCGPACLAMVIDYWGGRGSAGQRAIADSIFDPESQASFNSDMVLYPRVKGFASFSCRGSLETLKALVSDDIPVIVLTKAFRRIPKGHFRVVVGFDDRKGRIIFHDPLLGARRAMSTRRFMKAWELGKGWNRSRWMMAVVPLSRALPVPGLDADPLTSINLATAYYRKGDFARSRAEWEKARKALDRDPYPVYSLAMVSLKEGRSGEAEAMALEALRLDEGNAQAYDVLGLAYAAQGRIAEAFQALGRARRLDPKQAFIRSHYQKVRDFYIQNARAAMPQKKERDP